MESIEEIRERVMGGGGGGGKAWNKNGDAPESKGLGSMIYELCNVFREEKAGCEGKRECHVHVSDTSCFINLQ